MLSELTQRADSFWSRVQRGGADECWPWTGYCQPTGPRRLGYGRFSYAKSAAVRAHRAAWMLANGQDIPAGQNVLHHCDNPKCCNPAHLWLGSYADNNRDRADKGRTIRPARDEALVNHQRGTGHWAASLSAEQVEAIRQDSRQLKPIAKEYGVSISTISRIRRGDLWKSV